MTTNILTKKQLSIKAQTFATIISVVAAVALPHIFHIIGAVSGLNTGLGGSFSSYAFADNTYRPDSRTLRRSDIGSDFSSFELCSFRNAGACDASVYDDRTFRIRTRVRTYEKYKNALYY